LGSGGLNFDAKVRRGSIDPVDLFHAHIGAMDAFAKGMKVAARLINDRVLDNVLTERYSSYDTGIGAKIEAGKADFKELENFVLKNGEPKRTSGRQELLENIVNQYMFTE
jgi:xylose isomerase